MTQTTSLPSLTDATRRPRRVQRIRLWPLWILLVALTFIALESVLLALAMQGRWIILLAPGAVCASKAWETWKELKRRVV